MTTYAKQLKTLTDDQLIDEMHAARVAHENAPDGQKDAGMLRRYAIEAEMVSRDVNRGLVKKYHEKYPG